MDADGHQWTLGPPSSEPWGVRRPRARLLYSCICGRWQGRAIDGRPTQPPIRRLQRVVLHVVARPKIDPFLDEQRGRIRNFELKSAEIGMVGPNTV
jgi:hypothetical protein